MDCLLVRGSVRDHYFPNNVRGLRACVLNFPTLLFLFSISTFHTGGSSLFSVEQISIPAAHLPADQDQLIVFFGTDDSRRLLLERPG